MGLRARGKGFTLVELLVVIVIIGLLAALLLPALLKALCNARQGAAEQLVEQLTAAASQYESDYAVFPPGDGKDSVSLVSYLSRENAKKLTYFLFTQDMLFNGSARNPVWPDGSYGEDSIIHYRNNQPTSAGGSGGAAGGGGNQPPVYSKGRVDIWCAGCDLPGGATTSHWSVNNWE